jgi:adenylosuccinate lyase
VELEYRIANLKFRGVKGTTGTQASFLTLFDGDHAKVEALDKMITQRFGFEHSFPITSQTYPRKVDAQIINALAGIAASVHKICNDIRLLASLKQMEEPFEEEQVGSSAMAYKRNPMRCERATGLARFIISLASSPLQTAAEQWFERTLDDSSNRRLVLPESFLATDGILLIICNVAGGLVVYPKTIEAAVNAELPFMATEEILMEAVRAGGDRQELHEIIRRHSQEAAKLVKEQGKPNDLVARLADDPAFVRVNLNTVLEPGRFIGRSVEQTEQFVRDVVEPIRRRYQSQLGLPADLKV